MQNRQKETDDLAQLHHVEEQLAADPGSRDTLAQAIDLCLATGRIADAARHADAAIARYPDDQFFQNRQGNVLLAQGQFPEAEAVLQSLYLESGDSTVGFNLAWALYLQGRYQDAAQLLTAIVGQPGVPRGAAALLLRALHRQGDIRRAVEIAQDLLPTHGSDADFLAVTSLLYFDDGDLDKARQCSFAALANSAAAARPLEALVVAAHIALGDGDLGAADAQFTAALAASPDEGRSWAGLGMVSLMRHEYDAASQQLAKAVQCMPSHIGTWHILGWCKISQNDLVAANEVFLRALSLDHNFGESHGGLAVVSALRGEQAAAEENIRRALGLDPKSLSARYAQMVLDGDVKDLARFQKVVAKIVSDRGGLFAARLGPVLGRKRS